MKLSRQIVKELVFEAALFAACAGEIALCHGRPVLLAALLVVTALVAFAFWRGRHVVLIYLVGAIVGPTAEIICVKAGAWTYTNPTFLGIPLWLPLGWGMVILLIRGIAETLRKMSSA